MKQQSTIISCKNLSLSLHSSPRFWYDPYNIEHFLKTKFPRFPKGPYFRSTVRDLLGDDIFDADDEAWRRQQKVAGIEFHSPEFRSMTAESLLKLVHARLLPVLDTTVNGRPEIDQQNVLLTSLLLPPSGGGELRWLT